MVISGHASRPDVLRSSEVVSMLLDDDEMRTKRMALRPCLRPPDGRAVREKQEVKKRWDDKRGRKTKAKTAGAAATHTPQSTAAPSPAVTAPPGRMRVVEE